MSKENPKYNYKLILAYDGTNYSGWQVQHNATSIQALVHDAIKTIVREDIVLIGSGRTDAGVHAMGQVAHFKTSVELDLYRFLGSLNGLLPRDIRVMNIASVPPNFHAQRSAISKTYYYHLYLDPVQDPFRRLYSLHVQKKLDIDLLKEAAQHFVGKHDFSSFANEAHLGSASRDAVRHIYRLDIVREPGGVRLEFQGDGFLYKMVRNIVGTLLEVTSGKRKIEEIREILAARNRTKAGPAAPPHGLFLMHVEY